MKKHLSRIFVLLILILTLAHDHDSTVTAYQDQTTSKPAEKQFVL